MCDLATRNKFVFCMLKDVYGCLRDIKYSPRKLNMIAAQVCLDIETEVYCL